MQRQVPLVYFFGLVPGKYSAAWPAYVVGDEPAKLTFAVAVDDARAIRSQVAAVAEDETKGRRLYVTAAAKQRLHQAGFRERVLAAYRECCAVCRLKHRELLDAAHILLDRDPRGAPWVSNGLALCKIHHAAFDQDILGIHPDLIVKIRQDVLDETDGPMLQHGLQELNDRPLLVVPRADRLKPNREFLAERYEHFRKAG
jgi:putative restriction endonuclease